LADFQSRAGDFQAAGIRLLAISVDAEEHAQQTVQALQLTYPVGYGVSSSDISESTGAYFDAEKKFLHATGFIIRPDGTLAGGVYSTGPVGRYTAADALDIVTAWSKPK